MAGFIVRLATYHNGGFQEGVSLTIYDELARWEKYAYGCNELVFNPFIYWPMRGPFTKLFTKFLFSNIKITSKITIFAYIFTYYAIASAIPLTLVNYCVSGWFNADLDQFYLTSWKIFVGMAVVSAMLNSGVFLLLNQEPRSLTFSHLPHSPCYAIDSGKLLSFGPSLKPLSGLLCFSCSLAAYLGTCPRLFYVISST
jgi:Glycosyl transferase family group 2